jgi:drug/metabolite transporter (DMT)-like permease
MSQTALSPRSWLDMALLASLWGASFLSIKLALAELPVLTLVAQRVFWAALVLWAYVLWRGFELPRGPRIWAAFAVMGLLNNAIPFGLMAWGQQFIETGLTSIFNAATAVFGVLVAAMVFADERLTPRRLVGVTLAFAGVALAIGLDALRAFDIRSAAQLAVLAGALSYAFAAAWARAKLRHLRPEIAAAGMLTASSAMLLPLAILVDGVPQVPQSPLTFGAIAYVSILGTAVAYLLYYRVVAAAGSGNALIVTLLIPPVAIVLGALVLDERLGPDALAGFAMLALGLVVMNGGLRPRRRQARETPAPPGRSSAR